MMIKCRGVLVALVLLMAGWTCCAAAEWKPVPGNLMTRWAQNVDPKNPWPDYPRPQMVRPDWVNLNGLWDYAIVERAAAKPDKYEGQILVPFCVESALSGVKKPLTGQQRLWYRRTFAAPTLDGGKRLLLHLGAVDWEAVVSVNGQEVGTHRGGYDPFTFDITAALKPGAENELVVAVFDETGGMQPKGKQHFPAIAKPGGIMYTPCSGIWQTVWLEAVPAHHIDALHIVPDVDAGSVSIEVAGQGDAASVTVLSGDQTIGTATGKPGEKITVKVPNAKLWSPDTPFLYDLKVKLDDDQVSSYFGMRKMALAKDDKGILRTMLNNKFIFQSGPLDQGFWPDGIYTAPTDEALRYDIEVTKQLGFNFARKHVKVEPDRWYYWCDKLGLMVWQDMPSGGAGHAGGRDKKAGTVHDGVRVSDAANAQFEAELKAMVQTHWSHPAIVQWVVFNEGWGQYDTPRLVKWVKELDPSRIVDNASGWNDIKSGDVVDMHNYGAKAGSPTPEADRAAVLGECGGLGFPVPGHTWVDKNWGYIKMADTTMLTHRYVGLWQSIWSYKDNPGLCAAVYTQTTDVETECNGLLTYDRAIIKVDREKAAAAARGEFPPPPQVKEIVPTAQDQPVTWQYTMEKPADNWFALDFDATAWKAGPAGFGGGKVPGIAPRTPWRTDDIWLRREINLAGKLLNPMFRIYHDEDADVYVNGVLALQVPGYNTSYDDLDFTHDGAAALQPGKNIIAVHVHQTVGGQFIDLGIVDAVPAAGGK